MSNLKPKTALQDSFESMSKNIKNYPYIIYYNGDNIDHIVYNTGIIPITKTFHYTDGVLVTITLSGGLPQGIKKTKTLNYVDGNLTNITYS